jgi:hypothetical protein
MSGVLTQARGLCDDNKSVAFGLAAAVLVGFALWRSGLLQDSHGAPPPASRSSQTRRAAPRSSPANAAGRNTPVADDGGGARLWAHPPSCCGARKYERLSTGRALMGGTRD